MYVPRLQDMRDDDGGEMESDKDLLHDRRCNVRFWQVAGRRHSQTEIASSPGLGCW